MKVMCYRSHRKRIIYRLIYLVLSLIIINSFTIDTLAQDTPADNDTNSISIKTKRVDYYNRILYADIKIHLKLDANEESLYLILPIRESPGMSVNIEHNSNRTILSGFLGGGDYCIIQFLPDTESGEILISLVNVQFTIYVSLDEESFGSYELSFSKTKDNIPEYINSFIGIDEIRIIGENILYTKPDELRQGNAFVFDSDAENISVYIFKDESFFDIILSDFIPMIFYGLIGVIIYNTRMKDKIIRDVRKKRKFKTWIRIKTVIVFLVVFPGSLIVAFLLKLNKDATVVTSLVACFFIVKDIVGPIWEITKDDYKEQVPEENSLADSAEKKKDQDSQQVKNEGHVSKEVVD